MLPILTLLLTLPTLYTTVVAQCDVDDLQCCLTEFLVFVSPSGIKLSEQKVSSACTIRNETLECLDNFEEQCIKEEKKDLSQTIIKTKSFISSICLPTSSFISDVLTYQNCFESSSESFLHCFNTSMPQNFGNDADSELKNECCMYKEFRNCAVQKVEDSCGASASQVIQEDVVNINGAGLELACKDIFEQCGKAAGMLASSATLLISVFIIIMFSRMNS